MTDIVPPGIADEFTVLVVCSGNICRSPLAEQLLAARLKASGRPVRVSSAGTVAEQGFAMDATAAEISRRYGGDPSAHAARPLTEELIADSGLVLTATRQHRAAVVSLLPRASRYTFTLAEFARLSGGLAGTLPDGVVDAPSLVEAVAAERGHVLPPEDPSDDDIVDPYRQTPDVHEAVAARIDSLAGIVAGAFRALPSEGAR
ncbi:low molecular weight phosphatase family protein [Leifsonia sp. L25]|uniref:arsenate reductase/protein-tyrosine-phosphatase family protein n=1 Tax=Actinomycetes TaxID=1760 RepID=UPI003D685217